MTWFSKLMAVCLALLWVPMASHCDLEHLPGLEFLACCTHADAAPHQDNDCETDVCASIESASYKTEEHAVQAPVPLATALIHVLLLVAQPDTSISSDVVASSVPLELPRRWQFACRTAGSPRAPSFVS